MKKIFLLGLMVCSMTMVAQTEGETQPQKKESWYFKVGGSYFVQTAATEFPTVGGQAPNKDVYVGGQLVSRESVTGSFGEGFRADLGVGYRFTDRLGLEMGINYYASQTKTMAQTTDRIINAAPTYLSFTANGKIKAFDISPAVVLFLGEVKGFETYSKVGVIVPISGRLEIKTNKDVVSPAGLTKVYQKDVVKPNATVGFMAALGTSYKLCKNLSAFGELEYRNFTVHGKTKETTEYTVNGTDAMSSLTTSQIHTNYGNSIDTSSNNPTTNPTGFDSARPTDELSSYVGISGLGLTLGLRYHL